VTSAVLVDVGEGFDVAVVVGDVVIDVDIVFDAEGDPV